MTPVEEVASALRRYRFRYASEIDLQDAIADALLAERLPADREFRLDGRSRLDFLVYVRESRVAVEAKVAGSIGDLSRQVRRYLASPVVDGLVLVTNRARHVLPETVEGKPVEVVSLFLAL